MSRTKRGGKGPGYEYWSRRCPTFFLDPGKESKRLTKRYERRQAKADIERQLEEDNTDGC